MAGCIRRLHHLGCDHPSHLCNDLVTTLVYFLWRKKAVTPQHMANGRINGENKNAYI